MKPEELIGPRRRFSVIKAWIEAWSTGGKPSSTPLIVVGDAGCGKTTTVLAYAEAANFDVITSDGDVDRDSAHFKRLASDGRMPTFFGQRRIVVIEDAALLSKRAWDAVAKMGDGFPWVINAQAVEDVPYSIRRSALIAPLEAPTVEDRYAHALALIDDLALAHDEEDAMRIARNTTTWRSVNHALASTPPAFEFSAEAWTPARFGHEQITAILSGEYDGEITVHPLALITAAEFNGADPDTVMEAHLLHSRSWTAEGLSEVARSYLGTLRAPRTDKPPFRKRELTSKGRNV